MRGILVAIALCVSLPAAAETGAIEGTITDADTKKPLTGVHVEIVGDGSTTTNRDGWFQVTGLASRRYTIVFREANGGTLTQEVFVEPGSLVRLRLSLSLGVEVVQVKEKAKAWVPAPPPPNAVGPIGPPTRPGPAALAPPPSRVPYTDELIDSNDWAVVWLLVHVDPQGAVSKVDVLRSPRGYKLDEIALAQVKGLRFKPGIGSDGQPTASQVVYKLEWLPYWSRREGGTHNWVCQGSGPLNLGLSSTGYRPCDPPGVAVRQK